MAAATVGGLAVLRPRQVCEILGITPGHIGSWELQGLVHPRRVKVKPGTGAPDGVHVWLPLDEVLACAKKRLTVRHQRPWTAGEIERMRAMVADLTPTAAIAKALGRSAKAVEQYITREHHGLRAMLAGMGWLTPGEVGKLVGRKSATVHSWIVYRGLPAKSMDNGRGGDNFIAVAELRKWLRGTDEGRAMLAGLSPFARRTLRLSADERVNDRTKALAAGLGAA